LSHTITCNASL